MYGVFFLKSNEYKELGSPGQDALSVILLLDSDSFHMKVIYEMNPQPKKESTDLVSYT